MTSEQYRQALTALGLTQVGAAQALGFGERTSRRYAAQGVPEKHSAWLREKLEQFKLTKETEGEK